MLAMAMAMAMSGYSLTEDVIFDFQKIQILFSNLDKNDEQSVLLIRLIDEAKKNLDDRLRGLPDAFISNSDDYFLQIAGTRLVDLMVECKSNSSQEHQIQDLLYEQLYKFPYEKITNKLIDNKKNTLLTDKRSQLQDIKKEIESLQDSVMRDTANRYIKNHYNLSGHIKKKS